MAMRLSSGDVVRIVATGEEGLVVGIYCLLPEAVRVVLCSDGSLREFPFDAVEYVAVTSGPAVAAA